MQLLTTAPRYVEGTVNVVPASSTHRVGQYALAVWYLMTLLRKHCCDMMVLASTANMC